MRWESRLFISIRVWVLTKPPVGRPWRYQSFNAESLETFGAAPLLAIRRTKAAHHHGARSCEEAETDAARWGYGALDAETEAQVLAGIKGLMCGKTMVSVAQRLSAVRAADAIFVLGKGMVMASGTHDVLLREGGLYARLFSQETTEWPPWRLPNKFICGNTDERNATKGCAPTDV